MGQMPGCTTVPDGESGETTITDATEVLCGPCSS
jgi:hypothetical protein